MKSLLRFVLMIALVVIGKLNSTPADSAELMQTNEPQWIIPVHRANLHKKSAVTGSSLLSETGKFRSWRLMRNVAGVSE